VVNFGYAASTGFYARANSRLWRKNAAGAHSLLEIFVLVLKDNLGRTLIDIQDKRRMDIDIDRLYRWSLKTPYENRPHQHVMLADSGFLQGQNLRRLVTQ